MTLIKCLLEMRRGLYLALLICALVFVTGSSSASAIEDDTFLLLKPTFETGTSHRYAATMIMRDRTRKSETTDKLAEKANMTVREWKPDGSAVLIFKTEMLRMSQQGKKVPTTTLPAPEILTRSLQGKITQTAESGKENNNIHVVSGMFELVLGIVNTLLPTKPVRIGERWNVAYRLLEGKNLQKGVAELIAGEPISGMETFKIKIVSADTQKDPNAVTHVTIWLVVNRATGDILKFVQDMHIGTPQNHADIECVLQALGQDPKDDPKEEK
ncbi:MAG: hypothetical protein JWN14_4466 [Chthonomonadales bacterium]|nr:hypothetical protein [Chthonomonadales bacterium]